MKFRVEHDTLADAVAWVARALPSRPVVPILSSLRLDADDGLTLSPCREECGRNAGETRLDPESFLFQYADQVFGGLEFLKPEFTEAEDGVDHDLRLLFHAIDLSCDIILECRFSLGRNFLLAENQARG